MNPMFIESNEMVDKSWALLKSTNERKVFPGHGPHAIL